MLFPLWQVTSMANIIVDLQHTCLSHATATFGTARLYLWCSCILHGGKKYPLQSPFTPPLPPPHPPHSCPGLHSTLIPGLLSISVSLTCSVAPPTPGLHSLQSGAVCSSLHEITWVKETIESDGRHVVFHHLTRQRPNRFLLTSQPQSTASKTEHSSVSQLVGGSLKAVLIGSPPCGQWDVER